MLVVRLESLDQGIADDLRIQDYRDGALCTDWLVTPLEVSRQELRPCLGHGLIYVRIEICMSCLWR